MLQIPRSSANVSCNLDAGFKPVWAVVAEKALLFAQAIMTRPVTYWPKMAMQENILLGNKNPYTKYLMKIKTDNVQHVG